MLKRLARHTAIAIALAAIALPLTTQAQSGPNDGVGIATDDILNGCFNSGAGLTSFNVCVSSHGNVSRFNFQGSEVISNGGHIEGYVLCATTSAGAKVYHDTMSSEAGWGAAASATPGALPITVTRTTTDGAFTLTQQYAKDNAERDFTITMKLKANQAVVNVRLVRIADIDVDQNLSGSFTDHFDKSLDSVWGRQTRAFTATALTYNQAHTVAIEGFSTTCDNVGQARPFDGDSGSAIQYNFGSLSAGKTKTVKVAYRGM